MRQQLSHAIALACGLALFTGAPVAAQNLSLRAPVWAQPMLATDVTPTTGGRAVLGEDGIDLAVRVTIAPARGGVARVIRYDLRDERAQLAVRRFTGHPSTGWWLWGSDAPRVDAPSTAQRLEIANLARAVMGVGGALGAAGAGEACAAGEQAYIEVSLGGRSTSFSRACVAPTDSAGRLALRVSELAGSRTEEELAAAALSELLDADRAFAAAARADGVPTAFARFAADDTLIVTSSEIISGRQGVTAAFAQWPQGAQLEWAPEAGRVSARGDMGWTWGNSVRIATDGTRTPGRYMTTWTRDYEGNWRYAFDAAIK